MSTGEYQIRNAVIESTSLTKADHGVLCAWLFLDYGGSGQGFGGYSLYLPKDFSHHSLNINFAGHFVFRVLEIAGVDEWKNLPGKTIRVKMNHSTISAVGHIVKDDWFCPEDDFKPFSRKGDA